MCLVCTHNLEATRWEAGWLKFLKILTTAKMKSADLHSDHSWSRNQAGFGISERGCFPLTSMEKRNVPWACFRTQHVKVETRERGRAGVVRQGIFHTHARQCARTKGPLKSFRKCKVCFWKCPHIYHSGISWCIHILKTVFFWQIKLFSVSCV